MSGCNHRMGLMILRLAVVAVSLRIGGGAVGLCQDIGTSGLTPEAAKFLQEQVPNIDQCIIQLRDADPGVRQGAADLLGQLRDRRAVQPLIAALGDPEPSVRSEAAEALGYIGDAKAVEPLIAALKEADPSIRKSAAAALGGIKDPRAVGPLIAALKDSYAAVRYRATESLGKIGDPAAIQPLTAILQDPIPGIQMTAAASLAMLRSTDSSDALLERLKDPDPLIRRAAANALARAGTPRGVEALNAGAKDPAIVAGAYTFFLRKGDPETVKTLIDGLNQYGTETMAADFEHCGNKELQGAALNWIPAHVNLLRPIPVEAHGPKWGKGQ